MKKPKKQSLKIENLEKKEVVRRELSKEELRLAVGGLRRVEACSCTFNCDVDCD